ncbi:MAG TPA: XRE family transcriptional regulator [Allosphingosinicella sp.]|nr:XRE family transcriptional regulator [Allosphingosinicella sp.]
MTKRIKATISAAVLTWARTSAGYDLETAAAKLKVEEDRLAAWEADEDQPSIPQLRKMAELYKRPLAVLYLPEPPLAFQPMHDFRRLPDFGPRRFSPALTLEIRLAHQRRSLALDMLAEGGEEAPRFMLRANLNENVEAVAGRIRDALKVDYGVQSGWRDFLAAFRGWRTRIEELGVLVFQASRIEHEEASGFAYWADTLPFMVVNRKDAYPRRAFSLLHELAHLMLHQSGVSDLEIDAPRPQNDERIEIFCNQVAAATLMPRDLFLVEPLVAEKGEGRHEWSDETIKALALIYGVSREAVARRLLTFGRASEAFYTRKRAQYAREYQQLREREKEKNEGKGIPRNMPLETVANFGRPLVRMLIENYHQDRISLSEVSGYLGVKVRHLPGIEQQVGFG